MPRLDESEFSQVTRSAAGDPKRIQITLAKKIDATIEPPKSQRSFSLPSAVISVD